MLTNITLCNLIQPLVFTTQRQNPPRGGIWGLFGEGLKSGQGLTREKNLPKQGFFQVFLLQKQREN
jgi:hypothetical protein